MPTVAVEGHDVELECREGETIMGSLSRHGFTYRIGCRRLQLQFYHGKGVGTHFRSQ